MIAVITVIVAVAMWTISINFLFVIMWYFFTDLFGHCISSEISEIIYLASSFVEIRTNVGRTYTGCHIQYMSYVRSRDGNALV